ncbi:MAG: DJ-1/PfpI family protein [Nitrospiraceae bacterium]|nr:DJ-1/PfpI family protein [Nitrospiraceae bacterium]
MKPLAGKRVVMIIARNRFRDEEYAEPRKALEEAGASVTVASSSLETAEGMLGMKVKPDMLIGKVKEGDFDGIVFVGGGGAKEYFDDPHAQALARSFCERKKLTSAICIAPAILANAGVLTGKKATAFPSSTGALTAHGAVLSGTAVAADGNIVTGVGPEAAREFGKKLVDVLEHS